MGLKSQMTASSPGAVNVAGGNPSRLYRRQRSRTLMTCLRKAPIDSVKREGKGLHKRTISAAIPSTEEDMAVDDGLCKSARPRKTKTRN
jgi:hypothetical protein